MIDPLDTPAVQVQRDARRWKYGIPNCAISAANFTDIVTKHIADDPGPLLLATDDIDWGEQDDGRGIPKRTQPGWVRALVMDGMPEGDD